MLDKEWQAEVTGLQYFFFLPFPLLFFLLLTCSLVLLFRALFGLLLSVPGMPGDEAWLLQEEQAGGLADLAKIACERRAGGAGGC